MAWFHTSGPATSPQFTYMGSDAAMAARGAGLLGDWGWGDVAPIIQTATNVGTSIYGAVSQGTAAQGATAAFNAVTAALQQQHGRVALAQPQAIQAPAAAWYENPLVWLGAAVAALLALRR